MTDDFHTRTAAGPLFGGPQEAMPSEIPRPARYFERGRRGPSPDELLIAAEIYQAKGFKDPVSIARLKQDTKLDDRQVKGVVASLREEFGMPIGSRREQPSGYFWVVTEEDHEAAWGPYRAQMLTMARTLKRCDSPRRLAELAGQLEMELVGED
ncbi:MAG: hypothetical protein KDC27_11825 [Acidobacteria bacterium]|nr:hypothetical protein [Acidobacteriota bacterium]